MALMLFSIPAFSQNSFEGKIVYSITMEGEQAEETAAVMPQSYEYIFKGKNLKMKMNGGMMAAMMGEFIVDGENQTTYMINHISQRFGGNLFQWSPASCRI